MQNQSVQQANISIMSSFSGSKKVYVKGSSPDIRVPMREISLSATTGAFGEEENPPVRVYDTSGPYTDPDVQIHIHEGLRPLRTEWIT
ncbi:phosphomethylpyrimidine synthase ThiC, partial [Bacillus amyloliquefaciens]|nr:phosphomethylpyrimidine synthase ThiC [Bacillus amyloliquefaciens]